MRLWSTFRFLTGQGKNFRLGPGCLLAPLHACFSLSSFSPGVSPVLCDQVESRGEAVDTLREKFTDSQEESRMLRSKTEGAERRIKELDDANKELAAQLARKEEAFHQINVSDVLIWFLPLFDPSCCL